jgi:hypothetical protein
MPLSPTTSRTFRNELLRSLPAGVLETLSTSFGMLIAVRVHDAGNLAKATFQSATSTGLMASLFVVPVLLRMRSTVAHSAARVQFLGAVFFALAALMPRSEAVFILGCSLGLFFFALQIPLQTQIYRLNYPETIRGKLFSITGTTRALAAMAAGLIGGELLGWRLETHTWLLWAFAIAAAVSGFWTYGLPAIPWDAPDDAKGGLMSSLRWVREDRDFRTLLISWMIMGVGNLVAVALFVEFLANARHGHALPERTIVWITGVVPVIFRIAFTYPWGLIYDRVNFFVVRVVLNVLFAVSVLCFYLGDSEAWWVFAMAVFGLANAGGNVAWSLWVTKLAPKHAVAEYMSVHTFFTGLRGMLAPFLAFALMEATSFRVIGIGCALAILGASAFITVKARSPESDSENRLRSGGARLPEEEPSERL